MISANTYVRALPATAHMAVRRLHHLDILPAQLEVLHRCASLRGRVLTDHGTLEWPCRTVWEKHFMSSADFKMLPPWPEIMDMTWRKDYSLLLGFGFSCLRSRCLFVTSPATWPLLWLLEHSKELFWTLTLASALQHSEALWRVLCLHVWASEGKLEIQA